MQSRIVRPEEEGRRLREILRGPMQISYSAMKSAKWNGQILLNGERVSVDVRVRAGDRVEILLPESRPLYLPAPWPVPLRIPWEDEFLLIVDKPAGMASQSSLRQPEDSLENAVFSHAGCPENFMYRPVSRLDRGTGGLMVIAKDGHTQDLLQRMLHTDDYIREYLAMTEGIPDPREGLIDLPIGKEDAASVRRVVRPDGRPARTRYRVIEAPYSPGPASDTRPLPCDPARVASPSGDSSLSGARPDCPVPASEACPLPCDAARDASPSGNSSPFGTRERALVRLRLETGRTHQIRVHLAALGCPVCGDFLYGTELPEEFPRCFALHSAYLRLVHPLTGEVIELESLPGFAVQNKNY